MIIDAKTPLWGHQKSAILKGENLPYMGLFMETGTGKTATAIHLYRRKCKREARVLRCLIVSPGITLQNWRREFEKHCKVCPWIETLEGQGKKRLKTLTDNWEAKIFIVSYETLLMAPVFLALKQWQPEVLIIDESHRIKNPAAARTKRAYELSKIAKYRYALTGTPILNTAADIFTQIEVLDHGKTFPSHQRSLIKRFNEFRSTYFYDLNAGMSRDKYWPAWRPKQGSLEEIKKKIYPIAVAAKKEECLDLPPLLRITASVPLAPEQRRLYDAMKKDFIAYMDGQACVAQIAITKLLRLQQIVSGFVTLIGESGEEPKNVHLKDNPRALALKELLEDVTPQHKCLIWAVYRDNYEAIRRVCYAAKLKFVEVHGEIPEKKRQEAVDIFNSDPSIRVFIGHPGSAGIGINLVSASYSIFYSRSFSLEADLQAEARNYRGGSEIHAKITRIDLVAEGTVDEVILKKLASKMDIGSAVLADIAKELK